MRRGAAGAGAGGALHVVGADEVAVQLGDGRQQPPVVAGGEPVVAVEDHLAGRARQRVDQDGREQVHDRGAVRDGRDDVQVEEDVLLLNI